MTWQLWIVFTLFIINAVTQPTNVNKLRKIMTPEVAVGVAAANLAFAGLVLWGAA